MLPWDGLARGLSALLLMPGLPSLMALRQALLWLIRIESVAYSPPPPPSLPELLSKYLPIPSHEQGPVRENGPKQWQDPFSSPKASGLWGREPDKGPRQSPTHPLPPQGAMKAERDGKGDSMEHSKTGRWIYGAEGKQGHVKEFRLFPESSADLGLWR